MSSFRTILPSYQPDFQLDHSQKWMCIGSCFAQHMADRLQKAKFACFSNPFGILYNPLNIANCLGMACTNHTFTSDDLVYDGAHWYSHWHHSQFYHKDSAALLSKLQASTALVKQALSSTDVFIFTFGTAYYYQHLSSGIHVANCHKLPKTHFEKKRCSVSEITTRFYNLLSQLQKLNPSAKFIFTVSPIRHAKDGLIANTRSKAILHLAIEELLQQFSQASYFPSYEILMDDLRDYRFYDTDMLHPTKTAIDYIWNHFTQHLFPDSTHQLLKQVAAIHQAVAHRPFHPESDAHQQFLKDTLHKIEALEKQHPQLDYLKETKQLKALLI